MVEAEVAPAANDDEGDQHGHVDGGELNAVVQLDQRAAAVEVAIITVLAQQGLGLGQALGGFQRPFVDLLAFDGAFKESGVCALEAGRCRP